jgi:hypothetical protein
MKILKTLVVMCVLNLVLFESAKANPPAILVRELVEYLIKKSPSIAAKGTDDITRQVTAVVSKYGPEGAVFIQKAGPEGLEVLSKAGDNAPDIIKLVVKRGEEAVHVISKPGNLAIFIKHGDTAYDALAKHPGLAEDIINRFGGNGAKALSNLSRPNGQRLAILAKQNSLLGSEKSDDLLRVVTKHGDKAMDFIWRNKVALGTTAVMAAFIANPEPFLDGAKDLAVQGTKAAAPSLASASSFALNTTLLIGGIALILVCISPLKLLKTVGFSRK